MSDTTHEFTWLVRLGYAARGLVYLILGYLALAAASHVKKGGTAAFEVLQGAPLGTLVLWVVAAGLLAYALFKTISAVADIENHGKDWKGTGKRIGSAASAIAHTILAYAAFQYARGSEQSGSTGSGGGREIAGSILELPLGELAVGLVGLGFLLGAALQAKNAMTAGFLNHIAADAPRVIEPLGRVGHAARFAVFAIVGWSLAQAAWLDNEAVVKGLGEAILSMRDLGSSLYTISAVGLLCFGLFSLIVSLYRIIPELHASNLKR